MSEERDEAADRARIDRWLWCARFFKSRSAAALAVRSGHVRLNGQRVKPAHVVRIGDALHIEAPRATDRDVTVVGVPVRRGPAPEAATAYVETAESLERRRRASEERALKVAFAPPTDGRPDKRTRRLLLRARQRGAFNES
ncbi:MAG TPA: RNA-binding S4 domain-containing protein [Gammaproteobacteria bacterium]